MWDSVAGTSTDVELQNEYGESTIGMHARMIGQGLRKSIRFIGQQRVALVFLNQVRQKIGVFFGDDTTTPGGKAIPFFSSVRMKLYSGGKVKAGKDVIADKDVSKPITAGSSTYFPNSLSKRVASDFANS